MYQHGSRRAAGPVIAFKDLGIQNFTAADIDYRIRETFNAKLTAEALRPIFFDLEEQSQFAKGKNFCDSVIILEYCKCHFDVFHRFTVHNCGCFMTRVQVGIFI